MVPAIIALVKNDRRSTRLTLMSESKRVDGVCSVLEIARKCKIPTPTLDTIASLSRLQGEILGIYQRSD